MSLLLPKPERIRDPAHLARLRTLPCCVPGCRGRPTDAHHDRRDGSGGTSLIPPDDRAINICHGHHMEGHAIGWGTFEAKYGLDLRGVFAQRAKESRAVGLLKQPSQ